MLKTATAPSTAIAEGAAAPIGLTIVDALDRTHRTVHRAHRVNLSDVEVDDVRATALAWLSDIAKG